MGQRVGVLAAILAVLLAVVSIASHRTHTAAIIQKASANDSWQRYQSTRVKVHTLELGESLVQVFGAKGGSSEKAMADFAAQKKSQESKGKQIQEEAEKAQESGETEERRALRYDLGEGLLEVALVTSSLFFISHKKMFPVIGAIAGLIGLAIAATGLLIG
ncbi:MAG: hypothetical protein C5B51_30545 [Terriglobia bacterium]|nr:MAG: hypothetical protein C5B51_30545 [Terriglobia bacterium]